MLLEMHGVAAEVAGRALFQDVHGRVQSGDRVGLTGPNGAGKTTLMKILAGHLEPSSGTVHRGPGVRIGYLRQDQDLSGAGTLFEYALGASSGGIVQLERRLRRLEGEMAGDEAKLAAYGSALTLYEQRGGYAFEGRVRTVLRGLGFSAEDEEMAASGLSGGQRVRLALARILLEAPDILLLDEPTNHLDLPSLGWLEEALQQHRGGIVLVSHDRTFLRRVATQIWDFGPLGFHVFSGGYDAYHQHLTLEIERQERERKRLDAERARLLAYVRKYKAGNRATQARDRERKLGRLHDAAAPHRVHSFNLEFSAQPQGERTLFLQVHGLGQRYGERALWKELEFSLPEAGRLGIVGRNGSGKTTLLRALYGELQPQSGEVLWARGARLGYLRQVIEIEGQTPLDALLRLRGMTAFQARRLLARHLFAEEHLLTPVEELSGGEKSRLSLAVLVAQGANVLLLDEPTNHLDLPAQEALQEALREFAGTVVLVSHDRTLLESSCDMWLVLLTAGDWRIAHSWDEVADLTTRHLEIASPARPTGRAQPQRNRRAQRSQLRQEVSRLEQEIARAESERAEIETAFQRGPGEEAAQRATRFAQLLERIEELYAAWQEALEALEEQTAE